jgi:hypothetical protein
VVPKVGSPTEACQWPLQCCPFREKRDKTYFQTAEKFGNIEWSMRHGWSCTVAVLLASLVACNADRFSPLELCSHENFEANLRAMLDPISGNQKGWTDVEAAVARYAELVELNTCPRVPNARWPMSTNRTKPLIINAGEGSTATRFLNCVMRRIGHYGAHTRGGPEDAKSNKTEFMGCDDTVHYPSCTTGWDTFNYISDSPVAYMLPELLATHPNALVIHSFRDPASWQKSRIHKHLHQGAAGWHQAAPCGKTDHPMNHSKTNLDFVVYNAWAQCITPKGKRYMQLNVFDQDKSSVEEVTAILHFIHSNNLTIKPRVIGGMSNISTYEALAAALEDSCKEEAFTQAIAKANATGVPVIQQSFLKGVTIKTVGTKVQNQGRGGIRKDDGVARALERLKRKTCNPPQDPITKGDSCQFIIPHVGLGSGRNMVEESYQDKTLNVTRCCETCNAHPECMGWSINQKLKGCFLKLTVPDTSWWSFGKDANLASGFKAGLNRGTDDSSYKEWCTSAWNLTPDVASDTQADAQKRSAATWMDTQRGFGVGAGGDSVVAVPTKVS